jgi:hypothetical protein
MITVTNTKVAGFVPQWAPFRGFSILFDNPGRTVHPTPQYGLLACDVANDPALGFYRALHGSLAELDVRLLTHTYLFCPLPPASYHVTVWDGANDGNLAGVPLARREAIERLLADLPAGLRQPDDVLQMVERSPLVTRQDWNIVFRFGKLTLVGRNVLVAELEAATPADGERLQELVHARAELSEQVEAAYGFSPYRQYWPHVSLGYFANRELAQLALACVAGWNTHFAERLAEHTLHFDRASIYGFTDMATFFVASDDARAGSAPTPESVPR